MTQTDELMGGRIGAGGRGPRGARGRMGRRGRGLDLGPIVKCQLPTDRCTNPSCTSQTYCKPGTRQGCVKPTCKSTAVFIQ